MNHPIENGKCYVIHQGFGDIFKMFGGRVDLDFYPENRLTQFQKRCGVIFTKSIVTESAQMICVYDKRDVYVWKNGEWVNPDEQTFGTSFEIIETNVLGFKHSISVKIVGSEITKKLEEKLKLQYKS